MVMTVQVGHTQINNGDFENWTNLTPHTWDYEMIDTHNVVNPEHGNIDDWVYSFDAGVSRTTDAHTGNYAAIIHNWYNYAMTSLTYADTISAYPTHFSGAYKYTSGDPFVTGSLQLVVLSVMGDTIINEFEYFQHQQTWLEFSFDLNLITVPVDAADSIFIVFKNSEYACQQNIMTCNLLHLDNLSLTEGTASMGELGLPDKELVRIVDLMGRSTEFKPNIPLIYIYSDGSTERKLIIE